MTRRGPINEKRPSSFYFLRFIFAKKPLEFFFFTGNKAYEYNNFVIILKSNLYLLARNGSLKHHFTCIKFLTKNDILANFKWE